MKNEKFELWVVTDNHQYRMQNQKSNENIELTFWKENGVIKHFTTNFKKLIKMLESADKKLYSIEPL